MEKERIFFFQIDLVFKLIKEEDANKHYFTI